jgi:hypothetical protein
LCEEELCSTTASLESCDFKDRGVVQLPIVIVVVIIIIIIVVVFCMRERERLIFFLHTMPWWMRQEASCIRNQIMAAQSKRHVGLDCWNTNVVGLNPALCMDICAHFSVLCCPVYRPFPRP